MTRLNMYLLECSLIEGYLIAVFLMVNGLEYFIAGTRLKESWNRKGSSIKTMHSPGKCIVFPSSLCSASLTNG